MATADNISELRIRTPPPDETLSPRRLVKKRFTRVTANMLGLLIGFFMVGVILVEVHRSDAPHLLVGAAISVMALMPMCLISKYDDAPTLPL
jgi:hypothetical protein